MGLKLVVQKLCSKSSWVPVHTPLDSFTGTGSASRYLKLGENWKRLTPEGVRPNDIFLMTVSKRIHSNVLAVTLFHFCSALNTLSSWQV